MHREKDNVTEFDKFYFLAFISDVLIKGILDAAQR